MSLLEYRNKFAIDNPKRGKPIPEKHFFRWSNKNFYRTSYNDMRSPVCCTFILINLGTCKEQKCSHPWISRIYARSCAE